MHLKDKRVEYVLRDGSSDDSITDDGWLDWIIEDLPGDIVKYRVIE